MFGKKPYIIRILRSASQAPACRRGGGGLNPSFPKTRRILFPKAAAGILAIGLLLPAGLKSQWIYLTGSWTLQLDETYLRAGAGTDFQDPIPSAANQILCDIQPGSYGRTWVVYVRKQDSFWDSSLKLDIKRQSYPNISGGLNYFEISDTNQEFFYSTQRKKCSGIQFQFQLRGASVSLTPNTYTTTIVYTLIDS
jgi:hypothetical protein